MAENTKIEWAHHTFNPWRGCTKVSAGCDNCYAERGSNRNPKVLGEWGPQGTRVVAAESTWKQPLAWNRAAEAAGVRHRVFCASLADVFEADDTMPEASREAVKGARYRLLLTIMQTPHLDWLLLTKRPENVVRALREMLAWAHDMHDAACAWDHLPLAEKKARETLIKLLTAWLDGSPPHNVWAGASIEDQWTANVRVSRLLEVPAYIHFLSCEPLLDEIDLTWIEIIPVDPPDGPGVHLDALKGLLIQPSDEIGKHIDWVIVGGESGPNARPMHPDWVRSLRDQCVGADVPFFFKQWGEWSPIGNEKARTKVMEKGLPPVQTEPHRIAPNAVYRVGKANAGRLLDGREYNDVPRGEVSA